jgi:uncharacterized protein (TIGR00255 family)
MINSMTGYGKAVATIGRYQFEIEVKSLNNRFLEISMKLPQTIQAREYEIREIIRQKIKRGKLYVSINAHIDNGGTNTFSIDADKVGELLAELNAVKKKFDLKGTVKVKDLLAVKELFSLSMDEFSDADFASLKNALISSLDNLLLMKSNEGAELIKDIQNRLSTILTILNDIEENQKISLPEQYAKLKLRVNEILEGQTVNNERLEMEMALIIDKSTISEEGIRIKNHLKFFNEIITTGEDVGRKLNFLCQELLREANAISSKSGSSEITRSAVLLKEEIERIREQVQNFD